MLSESTEHEFAPPTAPPPLLKEAALYKLVRQGWLALDDQSLPQSFRDATDSLFDELTTYFGLPEATKVGLYPKKKGTEWGFYDIPQEKEFLTLRCALHPYTPLEVHAAQVWSKAASLLHRILCDLARANGMPVDSWNDMLEGTLALPTSESQAGGTLIRMFKYEPSGGFAGEHTDLGLLTLCIGSAPGLECLDMEKSVAADEKIWTPADPVVLVGQTIRGLSDGRINAGIHRVSATDKGRLSVVFALRHGFKHDIDLGKFGGQGTVKPRELYASMQIGVMNINATGSVRQNQLEELERRRLETEHAEQELATNGGLGMG